MSDYYPNRRLFMQNQNDLIAQRKNFFGAVRSDRSIGSGKLPSRIL